MSMIKTEAYKRICDFIEFHEESCKADSIVSVLKKVCEELNLNTKQKELACLFYSLSYSVPTALVCLFKFDEFLKNKELFWKKNKNKLIFQSDRRWVKMNDEFIKSFDSFIDSGIFKKLSKKETIDVSEAIDCICKCYYFSRFSAFLFLEAYITVFDKKTKKDKIDWKKGDTATSGLLNVINLDKEANEFDKKGVLVVDSHLLDRLLDKLIDSVSIGKNSAIIETNLCAYRKLFKGSRYLGFYADRMLGELMKTIEQYPEEAKLNQIFKSREKIIPKKYLGEANGWYGVRTELKKRFLKTGEWKW